jgi:hypothetical protein
VHKSSGCHKKEPQASSAWGSVVVVSFLGFWPGGLGCRGMGDSRLVGLTNRSYIVDCSTLNHVSARHRDISAHRYA